MSGWGAPFLFAALAMFAGDAAFALCDIRLVKQPDTVTLSYDSFDIAPGVGVFELSLENVAATECILDVEVRSLSGERPPLNVAGSGASIDVRPPGDTPHNVGSSRFTLAPKSRAVVRLEAVVDGAPVVKAGAYTQLFVLELYDQSTGVPAIPAVDAVVTLDSTPRAQMNIAGAAAHFEDGIAISYIDFGSITTGETRRVFIQVRANITSVLSITSENKGHLTNVTFRGASEVPYSAEIDGSFLDLQSTAYHVVTPPLTRAGQSLPLDLTIGDIADAYAGHYEDTLTVEIRPH